LSGTEAETTITDNVKSGQSEGLDRRTVLRGAAGAGLVVLGAGAVAACAPGQGGSASSHTPLGRIDDIPVGDGAVLKGPNGERYVVVRTSAEEVEAFSARCTHKGCPVSSAGGGRLSCPCHGSVFDLHTGDVIEGPAKRPLNKIKVDVTNGEIRLA
jgi:nitrite reductase/ring-hydroxylating ferredoxin subunit